MVVDVTDYDWQQAEHQDNGCSVDNRVKRFEAVRVIPGPVQILLDKSVSADYICKCISTPNNLDFSSSFGRYKVGVEDAWKDLITTGVCRTRVKGLRYTSNMKENQNKIAEQINPALKKKPFEITSNYMTRGWWDHWNPLTILHIFFVTYGYYCSSSSITHSISFTNRPCSITM